MPVEDLHFLAKHSIEEQFIMYVDSSRRDRSQFPTPSQYTITFTEPFRYVIGVEVLDVLIPRTMYNVDLDNNTLVVDFGTDVGKFELKVEPADYAVDTISDGINAAVQAGLNGRVTLTAEPKTPDNPFATGKVVFVASHPFSIDLKASTIREVIGFDEPCRADVAGAGTTFRVLGPHTAGSVPRPAREPVILYHPMELLPQPVEIREGDTASYRVMYPDDCVFEALNLTIDGLKHRVELRRSSGSHNEYPYMMGGVEYTLTIIVQEGAEATHSSTTPDFIAHQSTTVSLLTKVSLRPTQHVLEPPGLLVLTGHRCIKLRCPEIEQHINSSYIYGDNSPGIALIKLATRGYTQQRYDFQSIRYRQFQPIAKLTKATFRFETVTGDLYDFKGCNHTLLLAIKYLEPRSPNGFENFHQHSLNPNYNPDFVQYIVNNRRSLSPSDSESDGDGDDITAFASMYSIR